MKRIISTSITALLVLAFGTISGSSANAVNCAAFNKGTGTAYHVAGAMGSGLLNIAGQCHGI